MPVIYKSLDEAVEVARGLAPKILERAAQTDKDRSLPAETMAELRATGLLHLETPRRYGGPELNMDALLEVTTTLSEACGSTGWLYSLWAGHGWFVAQFPESAQEVVFSDPDYAVSTVVNTAGEVRPVDGGYLLTGKGSFSSGVDHCTWLIVRIKTDFGRDQPREDYWFLVPKSEFTIVDDWYTVGLRGTGSKSVVLTDVFVPSDRVISDAHVRKGETGAQLYGSPLYRAAGDFTLRLCAVGPELGIAQGMVNAFERRCREQGGDNAPALLRLAKAAVQVDSARELVMADARRYCNIPAGEASAIDRARCFRNAAYAAQLCREAAASLFEASGSASIYESSEMSLRWRDSVVAAAHASLRWDFHGLNYGLTAVGQPPIRR